MLTTLGIVIGILGVAATMTAANGLVTQRVYTAVPNGDDQATMVLCDDLFSGAGVTPSGTG